MGRLDDLLLEWEDRQGRGEPATPEMLCPDDATVRLALTEQIRLLRAFDALVAPAPEPMPAVPDRIGKYEVRGILGAGGMGVVYEAWDPALARRVAIKMIHPRHRALHGTRAVDRFVREGQALARLRHANIVDVYEAGLHDGSPYLV